MRRMLSVLLVLMMLPSFALANEYPSQVFLDEVKTYFDSCFRGRKIIGGAVVIAKEGEVLYRYAYGHLNANRVTEITTDTHFRVASVTKMVSAVGLMRLLEERNISLETPVKDIVGFHVVNPSFPDQPITIRQVLSHTSSCLSVNRYQPNWENLKPGSSYFSDKAAPGTRYEYSNLNGGLIGSMIEALSGQSVNTYMQENVFGPLGVDAAYHPGLLKNQEHIAPRLNKDGTVARTVKNSLNSLDEYNDTCSPRENTGMTVGGLYITANGLNRIITMLTRGGAIDGVRILSEESVHMMMADQQDIEGTSVHCDSEYGLCMYRVEDDEEGVWYGHQGRLEGLTANAFFQPNTGLSVVVIANGHNSKNENGVVSIARRVMTKAQDFLK